MRPRVMREDQSIDGALQRVAQDTKRDERVIFLQLEISAVVVSSQALDEEGCWEGGELADGVGEKVREEANIKL